MGCTSSTESIELDAEDISTVKRTAHVVVEESKDLLFALAFVWEVRQRQLGLESESLVRRVLRDEISIRTFADAPQSAPSRSVSMLVAEASTVTRNRAVSEIGPIAATRQLRGVSDAEERLRILRKAVEPVAREEVVQECRTYLLSLRSSTSNGDPGSRSQSQPTSSDTETAAPPQTYGRNKAVKPQFQSVEQSESPILRRNGTAAPSEIQNQKGKEPESPQPTPAGSTSGGGSTVVCQDGKEYTLPEGEWTATEDDYYFSDVEQLYYHPPSGCFFHPESNHWYDPIEDKWFEHSD